MFFCFDLLYFAGIDLRGAIYADRRRYLAQCLMPSTLVQLVHASDDGVALHDAAVASGFEGVIGKRKLSRYETGKRSPSWIKVKPVKTADFVIGGFTQGKGSRAPLGSLLVGYRDKKKLVYASHVGSGFDDTSLKKVKAALEPARHRKESLLRRAGAQCAYKVGGTQAGRRGQLSGMDRRWPPASAGVRAPEG